MPAIKRVPNDIHLLESGFNSCSSGFSVGTFWKICVEGLYYAIYQCACYLFTTDNIHQAIAQQPVSDVRFDFLS